MPLHLRQPVDFEVSRPMNQAMTKQSSGICSKSTKKVLRAG